ncbi:hypothetical protein Syun_025317 [Stephania yunnanensis]|uniref:FAD-binding PCMH-type domain-containing protein n=1 Tax=Stephania yunnanensis TaxID=152371 RepID=A0AAP0EUD7_9MAGN
MGSVGYPLRSAISLLVICLALSPCKASPPLILSSTTYDSTQGDGFLECLTFSSQHYEIKFYAPESNSYKTILQASIGNLRFASPETPKPRFIVTPSHESQVQTLVVCSRKHGLQIRVLSGGHDYEGLSYTSRVPFVMIDLVNLRSISIDIQDNSAWVQAGATLGEVYYRIAEKSRLHGFPAGFCHTVGVGGHISGGGYGGLMRKYGVAADHVVDARLVNANGEILDRETMGEDLFWAIRGGGAASFGVILAFKINLVLVPPVVTVSAINMTMEPETIAEIVHKWQYAAYSEVPKELSIEVIIFSMANNNNNNGTSSMLIAFQIIFLGPKEELLNLMKEKFHELRLEQNDYIEMSWIESTLFLDGYPNASPLNVLLDRTIPNKEAFKVKSDFVTTPISKIEFKRIFKRFVKEENFVMRLSPWGGRMNAISEKEIAFPHRYGNMYVITYMAWDGNQEGRTRTSHMCIKRSREIYSFMSPYVSKSPRAAYLNNRDLDLGQNKINGNTTYSEARIWGEKYFKNNFEKLVKVKSEVDPSNFFANEQSIPLIPEN